METRLLNEFLKKYFLRETVDTVIIGMPKRLNNEDSEIAPQVRQFVEHFKKHFRTNRSFPLMNGYKQARTPGYA